MRFSFKFKTEKTKGGTTRRPLVEITLVNGDKRQKAFAMVDSGADSSFIPREVAEVLGFELTGETKTTKGVGAEIATYERTIGVEISDGRQKTSIEDIPVTIAVKSQQWNTVLIGRAAFFDYFEIAFRQAANQIILKKSIERSF